MSATCGPPSQTPLAYFDPDGCCWRTSQGTFPWDSTPSSLILPRWGMTHAGALYELPTPALHMAEPVSSLLLSTPDTAPEAPNAGSNRRSHPSGLGNQVQALLPTPVADHSRGLPQPGTDFQSLPNVVVSLLPTPSVADVTGGHKNRSGDRSNELLLPGVVLTLMATPRVSASRTSRSAATRQDSTSAPSLEQCVEIARGQLPREFTSWNELAPSWRGASTNPPSDAGSALPDGLPLDLLSLDEPESA